MSEPARGPGQIRRTPKSRLLLGALGGFALLSGLWAALILLGLPVPAPRPDLAEVHGPLMVLGFLGTLIALERAVALGAKPGYLVPAAAGLGAAALAVGAPLAVGKVLLALAGAGFLLLYGAAARRQASLHLAVLAAGAACWLAAACLWLAGWDVARFVPWLAGFLVLTIAGERLELSRLVRLDRRARAAFLAASGLFGAGLLVSLVRVAPGVRIAGAGLVALAGWLAVYDVARRTVRRRGLTRYMASCLLAGYAWLAVAGVLWARFGTLSDGPAYDAMLHALFLGFVIGMVFAHAPVIVPAVFRKPVPYRRYFYAHLVALHASLLLRLVGGDLAGNHLAWQVGGVLNELALLGFIAATYAASRGRGRRDPSRQPVPRRLLAAAIPPNGAQI